MRRVEVWEENMRNIRYKSIAAVLSCVLIVALTACGTETSQRSGDGTDPKIKIRIAWWGGQSRHDYTKKLLELYTESHPHIEFETIPVEWDGYFDKLSTLAASGAMPDLVQMDYQYIDTYTDNGSLTDLQEYVDDGTIRVGDIEEDLLDAGKVKGRMTGVVITSSTLCVGYNAEVLEKTGTESPAEDWTWQDFIESASKISQITGKESVMTAAGITSDTNIFRYWVRQQGKELFNEEGTALGYEDISITADFFRMWKDLIDRNISPNPDETAQITSKGQDANPVVTGEAAYIFEWNNYTVKMSGLNDKLEIAMPPLSENTGEKGLWMKPGMFWSVADTSKVKQECAEFINWFINSEEANDIIMAERGVPVSSKIRKYLVESGKASRQQAEMFRYTDAAINYMGKTPAPEPKGIQDVNAAFQDAGNHVFYGDLTPEEGAEKFHEEANAILEKNN